MALPILTDLKTLKYNFRGTPFFRATKTVDLRSMAINFRGRPYTGIEVALCDYSLSPPAGTVSSHGYIVTLSMIATGNAQLTVAGGCQLVEVIAGVTMIETPSGVVSPGGSAGIYGWISIIADVAIVTPGGAVAAIVVVLILSPQPGDSLLNGTAANAGTFAILQGSQRVYECVLSSDGFDDVTVPISSFTSRQRVGDPSYADVTIPGLDAISSVLDRQTGSFSIYLLMVRYKIVLQREKLFEVNIVNLSISGSDDRKEMLLSGYKTSEAAEVPAVIPVSGVNYRSIDSGVITLRKQEPDLYLKPGDTVQYDGEEFTVEMLSVSYNPLSGSAQEISG